MTAKELLEELKYIADSPSAEHGGFHENAIATAKKAIEEITSLRRLVASLTKERDQLQQKLEAFTDWDKEPDALLGELKYIADSPAPEHGGFHERVTAAARGSVAKITSLRARVESLTQELAKCGRENCMGHEVEGCRRWVSKESSDLLRARAESLEKALRGIEDVEGCPEDDLSTINFMREIARKALQEGK